MNLPSGPLQSLQPPKAGAAPPAAVCTEEEIVQLVNDFYDRVRTDEVLGPVFNARIHHWPPHLRLLSDFWSSLLLGTSRFQGKPMPKHAALPGLRPELFQRWLALFSAATAAQPNVALQTQADALARRIAQRLWQGYQLANFPQAPPQGLWQQAAPPPEYCP